MCVCKRECESVCFCMHVHPTPYQKTKNKLITCTPVKVLCPIVSAGQVRLTGLPPTVTCSLAHGNILVALVANLSYILIMQQKPTVWISRRKVINETILPLLPQIKSNGGWQVVPPPTSLSWLISKKLKERIKDRNVAQMVEHWTGTPQRWVRFPGAAGDFSPRVNFQCRLLLS